MPQDAKTNNAITSYKPSELIAIFSAALGRQNEFAKLVGLRGIYQQRQNNPQGSVSTSVSEVCDFRDAVQS